MANKLVLYLGPLHETIKQSNNGNCWNNIKLQHLGFAFFFFSLWWARGAWGK